MRKKYIVLKDVSYGKHERHKMDVFIPKKPKARSGFILFIHGGGWSNGDKSMYDANLEHFCNLGYICGAINYRFVAENITVFDELDDINSALKTIKQKCRRLCLKIEKVILSGASAGAHLALLYAYTRKDEAPIDPVAVCAYCPPVDCAKPDFLLGVSGELEDWKYGLLSKCCGFTVNKGNLLSEQSQKALKKISPQEYVSSSSIPTAVFAGKQDELIPFEHVKKFVELLNENGVKNEFLLYENSGHALDKDPDTALKAEKIFENYAQIYFK